MTNGRVNLGVKTIKLLSSCQLNRIVKKKISKEAFMSTTENTYLSAYLNLKEDLTQIISNNAL